VRLAPLPGGRLAAAIATMAFVSGCAVSPSPRVDAPAPSPDKRAVSDTRPNDGGGIAPSPGTVGGSPVPSEAEQPRPPLPGLGAQAVTHALGVIGAPYRYGGTGPSGFDCSGLVRYSYQLAGLSLPRATNEQREVTRRLPPTEPLQAGDLVFFSRGKSALHVGIFAGDGRFVHAATRGGGVRLEALAAEHWRRRFLEARRVQQAGGRENNR
jgi:cell wall-associated NlpC family hydrolase